MTAHEYLKRISKLEKNIKTTTAELKEKENLKETISSPNLSNSSSRNTNQNDALFVNILERIEVLKERLNGYIRKQDTIKDKIRSLENAVYVDILLKYYAEGKTLGEIASEIGYSYDYTRTMKGKAIKEFEEKFLKRRKITQKNTKSHKISQ